MQKKVLPRFIATIVAVSASVGALAQEEAVELETYTAEEEVDDGLGILQTEPVDSVFGFGKTVLETPRAVSTVTSEFLDQFNATGINDIATFVPGSFTTSFFGVAGSLDIRGTPADNYFRGVKRLNNDGIFPTPIGASDRIDVIRGPMSPIAGPGRVGGAMNFVPKSARAETGQYMEDITGQVSYTTGSWDKSVLGAEFGGPGEIAGKSAGYYVFAEVENSGSYYNNDFNDQTLLQGSFNIDLSDSVRLEFGGMYQDWDGHENGGWNRVTQDLIDNNNYVTGQPNYTPPDANGDGLINHAEIIDITTGFSGAGFGETVACFGDFMGFEGTGSTQLFCPGPFNPADIDEGSIPTRDGIGIYGITAGETVKLDGSQVLITDVDVYSTQSTTLYFDVIVEMGGGWNMTNKLFYDSAKSRNSDAYGFNKAGDTWAIEDQLIFSNSFEFSPDFTMDVQISPSLRYTDAWYANDFVHEIFDRVDLTVGFNPASTLGSAVNNGEDLEPWGINDFSKSTQFGLAFLADTTFFDAIDMLVAVRQDYVDIEAETGDPAIFFARTPGETAEDSDTAFSYNFSLSYRSPWGIVPYFTTATQSTILAGTHDAVEVNNVREGTFLGESSMAEVGLKMNFFNDRLFAGIAAFEQERKSINSNVAEANEALKSEGYELELRWVPIDPLSIIGTYANLEVVRTDLGGSIFTFLGAEDVPQIDPALIWGGVISGNVIVEGEPPRGGIPENVYSLSAAYSLTSNWSATLSWTYVDEVEPSPLGGLVLPSYNLLNGSVGYENDTYAVKLNLNNVLDEQFYRANFPGLYGNLSVLPEKPFHWTMDFKLKF